MQTSFSAVCRHCLKYRPIVQTESIVDWKCVDCVIEEREKEMNCIDQFDPVTRPKHYNVSPAKCAKCSHPIECIDVTRHLGFNLGNVIKYLWRAEHKGALEDLKKARWYLDDLIKTEEARK